MNKNRTKLARAVAMTLVGTGLSTVGATGANAATTMYNTYNAFAAATPTDGTPPSGAQANKTDGWVWGFKWSSNGTPWGGAGTPPGPNSLEPSFVGINGSATPSSNTPFGYVGSAPVNWAIELNHPADAGVISQADSFDRYGVYADIDTAKGAWSDNALAGAQGWRHNTDYGLFRATVDTDVRLSASGLTQTGTNFGFTIFKGMDTNETEAYNHHGPWNSGNNASGVTANTLVAGGTTFTTADVIAHSVGVPHRAISTTSSFMPKPTRFIRSSWAVIETEVGSIRPTAMC